MSKSSLSLVRSPNLLLSELSEFSKETLQQNMNQLDPAYSLNADDENSYADPEEYSEDSDSDEDYNSF